jgi:hypothetical protein
MGDVTAAGLTGRAVGIDRVTDLPALSADIGTSPSTAPWAPTQVTNADGTWRRADGSDDPPNWDETCTDQNGKVFV